MAQTSREANLLGACALAVAERLPATAADAALVALAGWLGGTTVDGLARVLHLTHSGAVRLVDRLERDGLIERRPGPDGRSRSLHATPAGARAAARLQADRLGALEEVLAALDADERGALAPLLEKLLAGMTEGHAAAGRICRLCDPGVCGHPERCPVTRAARS
jgi:DNA-binding MarR family transcriptional regulator